MVERSTITQVIGSLMKNPQFLSEVDKYNLTPSDFDSAFAKYVFSAINNLYNGGAAKITEVDVDMYFQPHPTAKTVFETNNGIEYLIDAQDLAEPENFSFYYTRLKKFNVLRDLNKMGFNTKTIYTQDLTDPKYKEKNDRFEEMEVGDIFEAIKKGFTQLEKDYQKGTTGQVQSADHDIENLLSRLQISPDVGAPLQGDIFNTVVRGARKGRYYLRSASTGAGKSRSLIGDMCHLSYPVRFNREKFEWEMSGSTEKTLFISTEQEIDEVQTAILSYLTGINEEEILYQRYTSLEGKVVQQAIEVMQLYSQNVFIVTMPDPSIEKIKALVRQEWLIHDINNVIYDYLHESGSLLNEFRDLRMRTDQVLGQLSTALKELAVEMNLFMFSATQLNAKGEETGTLKGEGSIRGSRAIVDKCDIACILDRIEPEEIDRLEDVIQLIGIVPNQVTDIYKVRRGRFTRVKIWSYMDLGTCRKQDLFITNERYGEVENFKVHNFVINFESEQFEQTNVLVKKLNGIEEVEEPDNFRF